MMFMFALYSSSILSSHKSTAMAEKLQNDGICCNDKLDESDLAATSAMMFIDYSTSPECIYPI